MGSGGGGLIHVIWEEWGPTAARGFISQVQWLLNHWLLHHGFTIGISDTIADDGTMREINDTITKAKADVKEVINLAQKGELEMQPGMTMQQSFEQKVNQILNKARDNAGNSAQSSLDDTNNVKMTARRNRTESASLPRFAAPRTRSSARCSGKILSIPPGRSS